MSRYATELRFAKNLAPHAGAVMLSGFRTGIQGSSKPNGTPVTEKDLEVGDLVRSTLKTHRPGEPLLNEEDKEHVWGTGTQDKSRPRRRWVCDPIDGTWLYIGGVPTNMFSLALVEDGQPVVGVVLDPYTNSMFYAAVDTPAYLNGKRLTVNAVSEISGACFALPGGKVDSLDAPGLFADVINQGAEMVTYGSVIYDASLVALGFASAAIYPYTSPWDMAAIKVIVEGAGGRVTNFWGLEQPYDRPINGAIVSNGHIHEKAVSLVGRHFI